MYKMFFCVLKRFLKSTTNVKVLNLLSTQQNLQVACNMTPW